MILLQEAVTPDTILGSMKLGVKDEIALSQALYQNSIKTYEQTIAFEMKVVKVKGATAALTDPAIMGRLRERANRAAGSIVNTFNQDLEAKVAKWAEKGVMPSQAMVKEWAMNRATWKSQQVGVTETAWTSYGATLDFYERNDMDDMDVYVEPESAVCAICAQIVAGNPYTVKQARGLDLPIHPNCPHIARADPKRAKKHKLPDKPWTGGISPIPVDQKIGIPGNINKIFKRPTNKPPGPSIIQAPGRIELKIDQEIVATSDDLQAALAKKTAEEVTRKAAEKEAAAAGSREAAAKAAQETTQAAAKKAVEDAAKKAAEKVAKKEAAAVKRAEEAAKRKAYEEAKKAEKILAEQRAKTMGVEDRSIRAGYFKKTDLLTNKPKDLPDLEARLHELMPDAHVTKLFYDDTTIGDLSGLHTWAGEIKLNPKISQDLRSWLASPADEIATNDQMGALQTFLHEYNHGVMNINWTGYTSPFEVAVEEGLAERTSLLQLRMLLEGDARYTAEKVDSIINAVKGSYSGYVKAMDRLGDVFGQDFINRVAMSGGGTKRLDVMRTVMGTRAQRVEILEKLGVDKEYQSAFLKAIQVDAKALDNVSDFQTLLLPNISDAKTVQTHVQFIANEIENAATEYKKWTEALAVAEKDAVWDIKSNIKYYKELLERYGMTPQDAISMQGKKALAQAYDLARAEDLARTAAKAAEVVEKKVVEDAVTKAAKEAGRKAGLSNPVDIVSAGNRPKTIQEFEERMRAMLPDSGVKGFKYNMVSDTNALAFYDGQTGLIEIGEKLTADIERFIAGGATDESTASAIRVMLHEMDHGVTRLAYYDCQAIDGQVIMGMEEGMVERAAQAQLRALLSMDRTLTEGRIEELINSLDNSAIYKRWMRGAERLEDAIGRDAYTDLMMAGKERLGNLGKMLETKEQKQAFLEKLGIPADYQDEYIARTLDRWGIEIVPKDILATNRMGTSSLETFYVDLLPNIGNREAVAKTLRAIDEARAVKAAKAAAKAVEEAAARRASVTITRTGEFNREKFNEIRKALETINKEPLARTYGSTENDLVGRLNQILGYDKKPRYVPEMTTEEFQAAIQDGKVLYRGYGNGSGARTFQFVDGDYFSGKGIYGSGSYTAYGNDGIKVGKMYSNRGDGIILEMGLDPSAKVITSDALEDLMAKEWGKYFSFINKEKGLTQERFNVLDNLFIQYEGDPGLWAAMHGYDAIDVAQANYMIVLNREKVLVKTIYKTQDQEIISTATRVEGAAQKARDVKQLDMFADLKPIDAAAEKAAKEAAMRAAEEAASRETARVAKQAAEKAAKEATAKRAAEKEAERIAKEAASKAEEAKRASLRITANDLHLDDLNKQIDSLRKTINEEIAKFGEQGPENTVNAAMNRLLGYDKLPAIIEDEAQFRAAIDQDVGIIFRGIKRDINTGDRTAYGVQFATGDFNAGRGVYGSGTYGGYADTGFATATEYGHYGCVVKMGLDPTAKIADYNKLIADMTRESIAFRKEYAGVDLDWEWINRYFGDAGTFASAHGYDAILVPEREYIVILNREKVIVQSVNTGDFGRTVNLKEIIKSKEEQAAAKATEDVAARKIAEKEAKQVAAETAKQRTAEEAVARKEAKAAAKRVTKEARARAAREAKAKATAEKIAKKAAKDAEAKAAKEAERAAKAKAVQEAAVKKAAEAAAKKEAEAVARRVAEEARQAAKIAAEKQAAEQAAAKVQAAQEAAVKAAREARAARKAEAKAATSEGAITEEEALRSGYMTRIPDLLGEEAAKSLQELGAKLHEVMPTANVTKVLTQSKLKAGGVHNWQGEIILRKEDVVRHLEKMLTEGFDYSYNETSALKTFIHEFGHGVTGTTPANYASPFGVAMEEGLVEKVAREQVLSIMRASMGETRAQSLVVGQLSGSYDGYVAGIKRLEETLGRDFVDELYRSSTQRTAIMMRELGTGEQRLAFLERAGIPREMVDSYLKVNKIDYAAMWDPEQFYLKLLTQMEDKAATIDKVAAIEKSINATMDDLQRLRTQLTDLTLSTEERTLAREDIKQIQDLLQTRYGIQSDATSDAARYARTALDPGRAAARDAAKKAAIQEKKDLLANRAQTAREAVEKNKAAITARKLELEKGAIERAAQEAARKEALRIANEAAEKAAREAIDKVIAEKAAKLKAEKEAAEKAAKAAKEAAAKKAAAEEKNRVFVKSSDPEKLKEQVEEFKSSIRQTKVEQRGYADMNNAQNNMRKINKVMGYDKAPIKANDWTLERYEEAINNKYGTFYRGVAGNEDEVSKFATQFRDGEFYPGQGVYGSGSYTAYGKFGEFGESEYSGKNLAVRYAGGPGRGAIVEMGLKPEARVITWDRAEDMIATERKRLQLAGMTRREALDWGMDKGEWAAAHGYDAIDVVEKKYLIILNRSKVVIRRITIQGKVAP